MKARILLLLIIASLYGCESTPSVCDCKNLANEIKESDNKPTEPDDPRIEMLKKCHAANQKMSKQEKLEAQKKAENCN